jgi:CHAT domain-containing protein
VTSAALGERADLEARVGSTLAADSLYRAALDQLGDRIAPEIAWRLHAGWAGVLRAQGANDLAAREVRSAMTELERPSRSLALPERRSAFLVDKWEANGTKHPFYWAGFTAVSGSGTGGLAP